MQTQELQFKHNLEPFLEVKQDLNKPVLTGLPVAWQKLIISPLICATGLTDSETLVTIDRTEVDRCSFDLAIPEYEIRVQSSYMVK